MVGGVILGIYLGYKFGVDTDISSYTYKIVQERNIAKTIIYFCLGIGAGFIEYIVFMALYHILSNQSEMLYMLQKFYNESSKTSTIVGDKSEELPPL